jgi:diadenylate cyclase
MDGITQLANTIGWPTIFKTSAQILILIYAAFWLWARIKGTQAEKLVKGILVMGLFWAGSWSLGFTIITALIHQFIPIAVLAILIIFQPEIRRGLVFLGRGKKLSFDLLLGDQQNDYALRTIEALIKAVKELSKQKIGALIVVEPLEGERDYLSPGTSVNGEVSASLLLSIFYPNSPLHDGALVIRKDKIIAAGVILPMTDNPKLSYKYGTRHRAAIGLSEIYDGLCIVVSEETGIISAASRGMLVRYNSAEDLAEPLSYLYEHNTETKAPGPLHYFLTSFSRGKPRRRQKTTSEISNAKTQQVPPMELTDRTEPMSKPAPDPDGTPV